MVFSSNIFLFAFLPFTLIAYHLVDRGLKNHFLFAVSCFFYFWGSGQIALLFLAAVFANYYFSLLMARFEPKLRQALFWLGVVYNLGWLFYFKYFNFFYAELSRVAVNLGISLPPIAHIALPIGISFYTFQCIAYLAEVNKGDHPPAKSWLHFGTYLALFPHVVAGPIVRYSDIAAELSDRKVDIDGFFAGLWRFALGMGKKVVIANAVGEVADKIFGLPAAELTTGKAWLGIVCYTFQIYFDFSGYSDMAIGLARMFGFHFPENFNQPYRAASITEFWRRWHMTLSSWFRDFVYIPLGGNRKGPVRTYFNLWVVFFLCGLWHGANWTFVIWGLWHGLLLVAERWLKNRFGFEPRGRLAHIAAMLFVMIGWVFFRVETFDHAAYYLSAMFWPTALAKDLYPAAHYLNPQLLASLALAIFFACFPFEKLRLRLPDVIDALARGAVSLTLLAYSAAALSKAAFNPFIYFRF